MQRRRRQTCLVQTWEKHGTTAAAVAAALGWGLFLCERWRAQPAAPAAAKESPSKQARQTPASHRLLPARIPTPSTHDEPVSAAAAQPDGEEPAQLPQPLSEHAERQAALAAQLGQLRGALQSAGLSHEGGPAGAVPPALLLVREEVQLLDLAQELGQLRAMLQDHVLDAARETLSRAGSGAAPSAPSSTPSRARSGLVASTPAAAAPLELAAESTPMGGGGSGGQEERAEVASGSSHMAAFQQQRLTPLVLPGAGCPNSPPLHDSLQASPDQPTEQESWLSGEPATSAAAAAAVDGGCSSSVAPPAPSSRLPGTLDYQEQQQQQAEGWSLSTLAELRRSAPAGLPPCVRSATSTPRRSKPEGAMTPAGRTLRHSASMGSRQAGNASAAAGSKAGGQRPGSAGLSIPAYFPGSAGSTPASSRPGSARLHLLAGEGTPGSRIPKPQRTGWSPAGTPRDSRIPRPSSSTGGGGAGGS